MTRTSFRAYAARRIAVLVFLAIMAGAFALTLVAIKPLLAEPSSAQSAGKALPLPHVSGVRPVTVNPRMATQTVWVFGDSISTGQGLTDPATQSWVAQFAVRAHVNVVNWARPGYAFSGYLGTIKDELDTAYASGLTVPATVIVEAGTNDLPIHDATSLAASEWAAIAVRDSLIEHGATRVLFNAVVPRGDGFEALRQQFNMWLAIQWGADFRQVDFYFNPVSAALFAKYYQADRLHPNVAGAKLIADSFHL